MVSFIVIGINVVIWLLSFLLPQSSIQVFNNIFGLNVLFFEEKMYWQVITSMFLHANFLHLVLNMLVLYQFGTTLERFLGKLQFFLVYFVGGILCSLLSVLYVRYVYENQHEVINVVGASGAICVLIGYYVFFDRRQFVLLGIQILLISFLPLLFGVNVAWFAHIFGFICGYLLAKLRTLL